MQILDNSQESASYQELPTKRKNSVEKLDLLACVKEPSRDVFYYKVTTQREEFFDDHI
jgi:hypothetical protein